jgi:perosamine synthetase
LVVPFSSALDEFLIRDTASLADAANRLQTGKLGLLFVADAAGRVLGHLDGTMVAAKNGAGTTADAMTAGIATGAVALQLDGQGRAVGINMPGQARRVPIAEPTLGGNELKYVTECVTTNWISSQGSYVRHFEADFAKLLGVPHAIAVSNGTVALHLALAAYGIGPGDEVIVPDLTFAATINAVLYTGATPVLVDVSADTWNMNPDAVAAAITPRTKAIMPVHLYGQPADMAPILALAKRRGLIVVEDAAEAVGAKWNGTPCGAIGDCGTFSFFSNKLVTTGEGGMVVFKDDKIAARAKRLRDHGMNPDRKYWHDEVGFNYRLTNLQAAIGCAQLEQLEGFLVQKRRISNFYNARFAPVAGIETPAILEGFANSYWVYTILLDTADIGISRDALMARLADAGIDTRPVFFCLHDMPPYKGFSGNRSFANAARISAEGLSLPSSTSISDDELAFVADTVARLVAACRLAKASAA